MPGAKKKMGMRGLRGGGMAGKKVMGMRGGGKASKKGPVKRKKKKTSRR